MTITLSWILQVLALVAFVLATIGVSARVNLMALGLACWPSRDLTAPLRGLLAYNLPVAVYLGYLGLSGVGNGFLLWPAFVAHATLALLLTSATRVEYRRRVAR